MTFSPQTLAELLVPMLNGAGATKFTWHISAASPHLVSNLQAAWTPDSHSTKNWMAKEVLWYLQTVLFTAPAPELSAKAPERQGVQAECELTESLSTQFSLADIFSQLVFLDEESQFQISSEPMGCRLAWVYRPHWAARTKRSVVQSATCDFMGIKSVHWSITAFFKRREEKENRGLSHRELKMGGKLLSPGTETLLDKLGSSEENKYK